MRVDGKRSVVAIMITMRQFEIVYAAVEGEPEFAFALRGQEYEYMIIKYADGPTIARCGIEDGVGEVKFASLRELLEAETINGLCLSRDWDRIEHIVVNATFDLDSKYDRSDLGVETLINRSDSAVSQQGTHE